MKIYLTKINGILGALIRSASGTARSAPPAIAMPSLFAGFSALLLPILMIVALFAAIVLLALPGALAPMVSVAEPSSLSLASSAVSVGFAGTAMDIYSTNSLMGVVENLKRKINGFAKTFFSTVVTSDTEVISFDIDEGKRYLAPYVHPDVPAKVRGNKGRRVASFSPAYLKEKEAVKPGAALKRQMGESFGGTMSPAQRTNAQVGSIIQDQVDRVDRRVEQMAVEAIVTGKVVVTGDGYETTTVDFGRNANLSIAANTLLGANQWDDAASNPLKDIRGWNRTMLEISGAVIGDVILDADSADAFLDNAAVQAKLDKLNVNIGVMELMAAQEEGLQLIGQLEGRRFWQYAGWYTNDAGTELELFSGGKVVCIGAVDGIQNYGAIQDHDSLQSVPVFTKSWLEQDPSVRWILSQSAPLPVPRRINATLVAQVL